MYNITNVTKMKVTKVNKNIITFVKTFLVMEDRLLKLLDAEQLSSSKFADVIGVQRSSISHILSGRNKPSFDFLQKTLSAFPHLSAEWLILGKGKMYESGDYYGGGSLFYQPQKFVKNSADEVADNVVLDDKNADANVDLLASGSKIGSSGTFSSGIAQSDEVNQNLNEVSPAQAVENRSVAKRKVKRVILFYEDKTFESFDQEE